MAASTLTIAASTITRPSARILLNKWTLALDRPCELEFTEICPSGGMPGSFAPEQAVTLAIAGLGTVFSGWIISRNEAGFTRGMPSVGYRAIELKYAAYNWIPITAADGTGTMAFNLPSTSLNYQATESGLSVGTILSQVFAQHVTILTSYGITTDATTATQLAALTVVPPDPVYVQGNRLWSQVDQILQQWYGSRYAAVITGAGLIRIVDTLSLTAETLTFGTDPILLDSLSEDTSECFTSVLLRGRDNVEPAYLSLADGTIVDPNTSSGTNLEATWTINDYLNSGTGTDFGTVTTMSSTTLTVSDSSGTRTWAINYWSGLQAQVNALNTSSTSITMSEYRRITANTALTAGGTSVLTVDIPFANTGYTSYKIFASPPGISQCYRRLNIPNTYIAQHLVSQFNYAVPWSPMGSGVVQTYFPVGQVVGNSGGIGWSFPAQFEVIPYNGTTNGYVLFFQPWVSYFNSQANLVAGGTAVQQATDIQLLLAYSRGTMTAVYPPSGYGGTAYSRFGITRQLTRDYPTWWDQGSTTAMTTLAQQIWNTVSNVVQEGQVTYLGQYLLALVPGAPIALNLANYSGTTSYEAMAAPCRTVTLSWPQSGGAEWETAIQFSTRRQMYSGDRLYVHSNYSANGPLSSQGGGTFATGVASLATFSNDNFSSGNEFAPVFNQGELQALSRAQGQENVAQSQMAHGETDTRGADALSQVQQDERRAQDQVFGRGADPTAQ